MYIRMDKGKLKTKEATEDKLGMECTAVTYKFIEPSSSTDKPKDKKQ